jgi:glycosyltransferase involved in cell wall biosynthesis
VGEGPLRAELEALAGTLGLDVSFTGARPDARALIARADLLVVASDSEGQSLVALEALAAGTPVVSTPVAGMAGLAGVSVVAGFTPEALAGGIVELLRTPGRRAELGAAGAALARAELTLDAMVDAYAALYASILRDGNTMR